jgi:hypothetical protein
MREKTLATSHINYNILVTLSNRYKRNSEFWYQDIELMCIIVIIDKRTITAN